MFPAPIPRRARAKRIGYALAVAAAVALWLLPMLGILITSVRPADELHQGLWWAWPGHWSAGENYGTVLRDPRTLQFALNSVLIAVPAVLATLVLASMAGFALAKHEFRGNRLLLAVFVAGNLVPFQVLMIPVRDLMIALGLHDTRTALVLFHTAFQTGFATLFMRNFIRALPDGMLDAARVEGAGELVVFRHVVVPMVRPAMAAVAVLVFTFVWNDYFWSLVLVQSDAARPITAGLQAMRGMWQTSWQLVAAASVVAALPIVALFVAMQRHLVLGLTYSARSGEAR